MDCLHNHTLSQRPHFITSCHGQWAKVRQVTRVEGRGGTKELDDVIYIKNPKMGMLNKYNRRDLNSTNKITSCNVKCFFL
jgi:hypothetical protein